MEAVLVLNIDYTPLEVISWRDAIEKLFLGKVEMVESYVGRFVRSPSVEVPFPAVVRLVTGFARRKVRLSRKNVLARDSYACQYCRARPRRPGGAPDLAELTLDHVVPRSRSVDGYVVLPWSGERTRVTSWKNVLTACVACNSRKAARTPSEAGMPMGRPPRAPSPVDVARMSVFRYRIPTEWQDYLPEGSPWRGYWEEDLH